MSIRVVVAGVCIASGMFGAAGISLRAQTQQLISSCVKASGQVRIVSATEACNAGEQRLEWPATAPSLGPLRVVDANGTFIGRYGDGTTIMSVGTEWISASLTVDGPRNYGSGPTWYFNTVCPNPSDNTVLHGTLGYFHVTTRELVKFALAFPEALNVLYYPGAEEPGFVALSLEFHESTVDGPRRVCSTLQQPIGSQKFAPAVVLDLSGFTTPYRIVQ
jgi:hypothetical protein